MLASRVELKTFSDISNTVEKTKNEEIINLFHNNYPIIR